MTKMAKADIVKINADYDKVIASLTGMAARLKSTMPLVASSLLLTVEIVEVYKKAFNANIPK